MAVTVHRATRPPTTASLTDEKEWRALVAKQLADVRKKAESWRTGLAAMIALISGFSIVKGPEGIDRLPTELKVAVGVALLIAFVAAIAGAWFALEAATGTPTAVSRADIDALGGFNGFKLALAAQSAALLDRAKRATLVSLVGLVTATGVTWYGPSAAPSLLEVTLTSQPSVCGKLVRSEYGFMDIAPQQSAIVRIPVKDATSVKPVTSCP